MTDAIIPNLIIYKSCRTDFGWNETVCDDYNLIYNYPEQNDIVNDEVIHKCYLLKSYSENCAHIKYKISIFGRIKRKFICISCHF